MDDETCPECGGSGLTWCPGLGTVECPECEPRDPVLPPATPGWAEVRWGVPEAEA